jgi:hypothetical protein
MVGLALSVVGVAVIALLTLRSNPASRLVVPAPCCAAFDIVFNVLLFMPLGAGLVLLGLRPRYALAGGTLLSVVIELAQRWWVVGRFASLHDVASNAAGCLLGILIVAQWGRRAAWWPVLAPFLAVSVVLAWFLGGYVAQPAIPGPSTWVAESAHTPSSMSPFVGQVVDAQLQGVPLPDGPIGNLSALRARLSASRTVAFTAMIVTGVAPAGRSRLFEIVVGEGTVPFLVLDQEGEALLAYQRLGLNWVRLPGPWLVLDDALPRDAGDTVHVRLEATRRHLRLVAERAGVKHETSIRLAPELYFGAVSARATDGAVWWSAVPAVATFVLLGLSLASRPILLIGASVASLILSAVGGGCALPAWPIALLAIVGALAGQALGRRIGLFGA